MDGKDGTQTGLDGTSFTFLFSLPHYWLSATRTTANNKKQQQQSRSTSSKPNSTAPRKEGSSNGTPCACVDRLKGSGVGGAIMGRDTVSSWLEIMFSVLFYLSGFRVGLTCRMAFMAQFKPFS